MLTLTKEYTKRILRQIEEETKLADKLEKKEMAISENFRNLTTVNELRKNIIKLQKAVELGYIG